MTCWLKESWRNKVMSSSVFLHDSCADRLQIPENENADIRGFLKWPSYYDPGMVGLKLPFQKTYCTLSMIRCWKYWREYVFQLTRSILWLPNGKKRTWRVGHIPWVALFILLPVEPLPEMEKRFCLDAPSVLCSCFTVSHIIFSGNKGFRCLFSKKRCIQMMVIKSVKIKSSLDYPLEEKNVDACLPCLVFFLFLYCSLMTLKHTHFLLISMEQSPLLTLGEAAGALCLNKSELKRKNPVNPRSPGSSTVM